MKSTIIKIQLLSAILLVIVGCSSNPPIGQVQTFFVGQEGVAYILTSNDSLLVWSYNLKRGKQEKLMLPSDYPRQFSWTNNPDTVEHHKEYDELHVKKLTNKGTSVVIEGGRFYINDELYSCDSFRDPSDSVSYITLWGKTDTIIMHKKECPYPFEVVLGEIQKNYPEIVHTIEDTLIHDYNNGSRSQSGFLPSYIYSIRCLLKSKYYLSLQKNNHEKVNIISNNSCSNICL